MFVLFISYVLHFDFTKGNAGNQMPPRLLEMSLKHVNTLLADIDDNIAIERELLSQIDNSSPVTEDNKNKIENLIRSDLNILPQNKGVQYIDKGDKKATIFANERPPDVTLKPSQSSGTHVEMHPRQPPNWPPFIKNVVPELPVFEPGPPFENPIIHSTTGPPITTVNTPPPNAIPDYIKNSPIRKSMADFMKRENVKYTCAFVKGLAESLTPKTENTLKALLEAFGTVLLRKVNTNQFNCGGELLVKRFKEIAAAAKTVSPITLRNILSGVLNALQYRLVAFPDGLELLMLYDNFFNDLEGNHLLDIIVAVNNFNIQTHGERIAETLCARTIEAFTAPGQRLCGTPQLKAFIEKLNDVYLRRYQTMRSGQGNIIMSLIETLMSSGLPIRRFLSTNFTSMPSGQGNFIISLIETLLTSGLPIHQFLNTNFTNMLLGQGNTISSLMETFLTSGKPNRRFLGTTFKNIKSEYKNMIRHYMKKHPTIFRTFAKHYKRSEERNKHRHSKHKRHNSHHRKHHHRNHERKHHKEKTSKIIRHIKNKNNDNKIVTKTKRKQPYFRVLPELNRNENLVTKIQKRFNIVDNSSRKFGHIIPSVLSRRFLGDKKNKYIPGSTENIQRNYIFNNLSQSFPTTSISTKRLSHNNTILEKIIGDSSYSDEEVYFKTMLKDAYFHGNYTLTGDHPG